MIITQNEEIYSSAFISAFDMPDFDYFAAGSKTSATASSSGTRSELVVDDLLSMPLGYDASFDCLFGRGDPIAIPGSDASQLIQNAASFPTFDFKEEYRIGSPSESFDEEELSFRTSAKRPCPSPTYSTSSDLYERPFSATPAASAELPKDPVSRKRERNRLAAERCRQRKADLIGSLQKECEELKRQKERLLEENARLLRALGLA